MRRSLLLIMLLLPLATMAQWRSGFEPLHDSVKRWDCHVALGTGISVGNGITVAYLGVAPEIEYHPSDRFTLVAGFSALNSTDPSRFYLHGNEPRSLAPRKNSSLALSVYMAAEYQVNDRLWLAASLFHQGGQLLMPAGFGWWGFVPNGLPLDLDRTGFSAHLRYRIGDDNYLNVHMSIIRDRSSLPLFYPSYYGFNDCIPFSPCMGGFCSPYFHY